MKDVMRITYLLTFFAFLLFLLPSPCYCENTVYVSIDGNDKNPGTVEAPLRTIKYVILNAAPNNYNNVKISEGEYFENVGMENGNSIVCGYMRREFRYS